MNRPWTRGWRAWAVALLLMAPASIPYLTHFLENRPYSRPSGYIQPDMPIYMAKAREYFDSGRFFPVYANPCGGSFDGPRLYFQPWTLALGAIHRFGGVRPILLFPAFWLVTAWTCARVALALYNEIVGTETRAKRVALGLFFWGGGLLCLAGAVVALFRTGHVAWDDLFALDPFEGWWFLNFGRNLVYPTESLYHALIFGTLLQMLRGRNALGWLLAALTATCSPFAGAEILAILGVWNVWEIITARESRPKLANLLVLFALIGGFLSYYTFLLENYSEHRQIREQMSLDWHLPLESAVLGGAFVIPLATLGVLSSRAYASPRGRLLMSWAMAAFALSEHDWLIQPRQPLHFTRGYAWTALFFLAASPLIGLIERLGTLRRPWRGIATALLVLAFVSDNTLWFSGFVRDRKSPGRNGVRFRQDEWEVLRTMDRPENRNVLVLCQDDRLSYWIIAETPARSWVGHHLETPGYPDRRAEIEALFHHGRFLAEWENREILVIEERQSDVDRSIEWVKSRGGFLVLSNRKFRLYRIVTKCRALQSIPGRHGPEETRPD